MARTLTVNGRQYAWPDRPLVVVCIDGSEPDYTTRAVAAGVMPWLAKARPGGADLLAGAAAAVQMAGAGLDARAVFAFWQLQHSIAKHNDGNDSFLDRYAVDESDPLRALLDTDFRSAVIEAIDNLPLTPGMTLHVAAANADALKDQVPAALKISVDPNLKPGDCRLESDSGGVDARLEVRAHELRQRLLATLLDGRGDAE